MNPVFSCLIILVVHSPNELVISAYLPGAIGIGFGGLKTVFLAFGIPLSSQRPFFLASANKSLLDGLEGADIFKSANGDFVVEGLSNGDLVVEALSNGDLVVEA